MARETVEPRDWEALPWEITPYKGVFLFKLEEEPDPSNLDVPLFSVFALKVRPGSSIPRHIHKRDPEWREYITSEEVGDFEILHAVGSEKVSGKLLVRTIKPYEVFGVENYDFRPLYFTSRMVPGFTGYQEIEEVEKVK